MNLQNIILARRFAMEYGTFLGIAWILDFILITNGIASNSFLLLIGCMMFFSLPLITFYLAFRYKQHLTTGERHSPGCAAYFTVMMFIFAEIVSFLYHYAYFTYIDDGHIFAVFQSMLTDQSIVAEYTKMGMTDFLETAMTQLDELAALSPTELASNLFGSNVLTSFILFVPTWLIASQKAKDYSKKARTT